MKKDYIIITMFVQEIVFKYKAKYSMRLYIIIVYINMYL